MVVQAPISRHQQGDKTLAGRTTMTPRTNIIAMPSMPANMQNERENYFKYHARGGPNVRDGRGRGRGSGEDGNVYGQPVALSGRGAPLGSDPKTWSPSGRGISFGTENPNRSIEHHIKGSLSVTHPGDMDYTTKRGDRDFHHSGHNIRKHRVPFMPSGKGMCGGNVFKKKPSWNTKDNIAAPKHY